jgi:hypothetical protein
VRGGATDAAIHYSAPEPGEDEALTLRIVEFRPRAGAAERVEVRIRVAASRGTANLTGLEPGSVLRGALVLARASGLVVLSSAAEVAGGGALASGAGSVLFAPRRKVDYLALLSG